MKHNGLVQRFLERGIPFNDHLGIEVEHLEVGESVMHLPMRPEMVGDPFRPAVHGGVISTLADTCGGLAAFTALRDDQVASTLDLRVDYLLPGNVELDLWAVSRVIRAGSRVCTTHTIVHQGDPDTPVATATAVYAVVKANLPSD